jgi:peptidoglycan/xylan/chitin deacetylase (PgdA/CDA1 family)
LQREVPPANAIERIWRGLSRRIHPPQTSALWVYHRVHPSARENNTFGLKVHPDDLRAHWTSLQEKHQFFFADDLIEQYGDMAPRFCLAMTFDDGYVDNYDHLFPIVRELGIPVTIFLNTDWLGGQNWRLCDLLETCSTEGSLLKEELLSTAWRTHHLKPEEILDLARARWHKELASKPTQHDDCIGLTIEQVKEMASSGLVRFEAHGHQHLCHQDVSREEVTQDLRVNLEQIERITGRRPKGMAYPFGRINDVHSDAISVNEDLGLKWGLLASNGSSSPHTHPQLMDRRDPPPFSA